MVFSRDYYHNSSSDKLLEVGGKLEEDSVGSASSSPLSPPWSKQLNGNGKLSNRRHRSRILLLLVVLVIVAPLLYIAGWSRDAQTLRQRWRQGFHDGWTYNTPAPVSLPHIYDGPYTRNPINSTLGFEKVIVINLPHRKDKHDELLMLAEVSGINLTFVSTKTMDQMQSTELPYHGKMANVRGAVGVARAHIDAWVRMLDEGWQSALILEDDSDWDVDWRYALQQLQQPFAQLVNSVDDGTNRKRTPLTPTPHDPWMTSEWDVFNFGPCLEAPFGSKHGPQERTPLVPDFNKPPHIMYDDKTMPYHNYERDGKELLKYFAHYNQSAAWPKDAQSTTKTPQRMVTLSHVPVCMNAYALTRAGATRFLHHSTRELYAAIDNIMADLTASDKLRGYEVIPPVMSQWKVKDHHLISSDNQLSSAGKSPEDLARYKEQIAEAEANDKLNHNPSIGQSAYIQNSMRAAIPDILTDRTRQWPL